MKHWKSYFISVALFQIFLDILVLQKLPTGIYREINFFYKTTDFWQLRYSDYEIYKLVQSHKHDITNSSTIIKV